MEAADIEPSMKHDTSDSLSELKQNTFLRSICEMYVKWAELPLPLDLDLGRVS